MDNMDGRHSNGTFRSGHEGFKPKGSTNQVQRIAREKLGVFLTSKLDELPEIYTRLTPREKARLLLSCVEYFLPKQKEVELDVRQSVDLTQLSQEQLTEFLDGIKSSIQNE